MFSQTTEYALRAAAYLAQNHPHACNSQEVAEATKVPPGYMSKVLLGLAKAGIVRSQRGMGGGFVLAREPKAITILDVVNVFDNVQVIDRCPLGLPEHHELCPLHQQLNEAIWVVRKSLGGTSLEDLTRQATESICCKLHK